MTSHADGSRPSRLSVKPAFLALCGGCFMLFVMLTLKVGSFVLWSY